MNVELRGNNLVNADVAKPDFVYATFSEDVTERTKKETVALINYATRIRGMNVHTKDIRDIVELMADLEWEKNNLEYELMLARRYDNDMLSR